MKLKVKNKQKNTKCEMLGKTITRCCFRNRCARVQLFDRRVRRLRGLEGEAQHELEEEEIEEQQAMLQNVTGKGIDTIAPDVLAKGLMQDIGELDSCETGGWYMQPYNGAYPIYVVSLNSNSRKKCMNTDDYG